MRQPSSGPLQGAGKKKDNMQWKSFKTSAASGSCRQHQCNVLEKELLCSSKACSRQTLWSVSSKLPPVSLFLHMKSQLRIRSGGGAKKKEKEHQWNVKGCWKEQRRQSDKRKCMFYTTCDIARCCLWCVRQCFRKCWPKWLVVYRRLLPYTQTLFSSHVFHHTAEPSTAPPLDWRCFFSNCHQTSIKCTDCFCQGRMLPSTFLCWGSVTRGKTSRDMGINFQNCKATRKNCYSSLPAAVTVFFFFFVKLDKGPKVCL